MVIIHNVAASAGVSTPGVSHVVGDGRAMNALKRAKGTSPAVSESTTAPADVDSRPVWELS